MSALADALLRYGTTSRLVPGQELVRQGEASNGLYFVESGLLRAYKEQPGGELFPLSVIRPGGIVGEIGSVTGAQRSATVRAEVDSVVIHVPEKDLRQALAEQPSLASDLVREVGSRLVGADDARLALDKSYERAAVRTGALRALNAKLREEAALRAELSDMIVHDLRNPLAVVAGGLQLLELAQGEGDAVTRPLFESVGRSVRRMQRLVDNLLDVARGEAGTLSLHLAEVDGATLVEETVREEAALAEASGVALVNATGERPPRIQADPEVLSRVLVNLVDNALKVTRKGGEVTVAARRESYPDRSWLRFDVGDGGPGIPVAERARIFDKFAQLADSGASRRGSGLGLTFCRLAVEAHQGRIWVEERGDGREGARFSFALPLPPDPPPQGAE